MVLLILLLSFSLGLPFCCHMEIPESFSHHQDSSIQAGQTQHPGSTDCNCGHQLRKDFQKNKKQLGSISPDLFSSLIATGKWEIPNSFSLSHIAVVESFQKFSQPPIYLLHSVFLN